MSSPKEIVDASIKSILLNAIEQNTVVVFSKSWCPYCKKAKRLLATEYSGTEVTVLELDEREDGGALQDYLQEKTGQRSVPNIFVKQQHIGGSDVLEARHSKGEIRSLLN
ncbi:thioredoxin-like protein [Lactifluus subvellereus]|nr:thioredoxin-like protein [Lactifluus subvellereus]